MLVLSDGDGQEERKQKEGKEVSLPRHLPLSYSLCLFFFPSSSRFAPSLIARHTVTLIASHRTPRLAFKGHKVRSAVLSYW
jgi:hypothetical protein